MLSRRPLETTARAEDVFKVLATYFNDKDINGEKLVVVSTDGAPAILGSKSRFITIMKQNSPSTSGTHGDIIITKVIRVAFFALYTLSKESDEIFHPFVNYSRPPCSLRTQTLVFNINNLCSPKRDLRSRLVCPL